MTDRQRIVLAGAGDQQVFKPFPGPSIFAYTSRSLEFQLVM